MKCIAYSACSVYYALAQRDDNAANDDDNNGHGKWKKMCRYELRVYV